MRAAAMLVAVASLLSGCSGCASTIASTLGVTPKVSSPVMALVGRFGMGHACPVAGNVFTAGHVGVYRPTPKEADWPVNYAWSQGSLSGYASTNLVSPSRDLAILSTVGDSPEFNECASGPPAIGSRVSWFEYDFLTTIERFAMVEELTAGHIQFDKTPKPGASGSCLFNEDGEVLGIVNWRLYDQGYGGVGIAVALYGDWWADGTQ